VEHHDDVGALFEGRPVTGLLIAAIAKVLAVDDHVEAEAPSDVDGLVLGHIVDEDDAIHDLVRNIGVGPLERQGGVVGGHDDDDAGGTVVRRRTGLGGLRRG